MKDSKITTKGIIGIIGLVAMIGLAGCSASFDRSVKDAYSDFSGGLNREVSVYTHSGELLRTYEGKIDIEHSEDGKVKFDIDGENRVMIYNAIVIIEEK